MPIETQTRGSVLIVEDDADIQQALSRILEAEGYSAVNGRRIERDVKIGARRPSHLRPVGAHPPRALLER